MAEFYNDIPLLGQSSMIQIDKDLMQLPGFSTDQLMELAGLSVAASIVDCYPEAKRALIIAGPGNNGGDAFVAARHLYHFGFDVEITYPKRVNKPLFDNLLAQMEALHINVSPDIPDPTSWSDHFDLVVDGIFGYSFDASRGIRAPFDKVIDSLIETKVPIVAVDIPSGWHIETGPVALEKFIKADMLISLTAPKVCTKYFEGRHHYLGGRFLTPEVVERYNLKELPPYQSHNQFVKLNWEKNDC